MSPGVSSFFLVAIQFVISLPLAGQFTSTWFRASLGNGGGHSGMVVADIDDDGRDEIIANASIPWTYGTNFWFILEDEANEGNLNPTFVSGLELYANQRIQHVHVDNRHYYLEGARLDLSNVQFPLQLRLYDLSSRELLRQEVFPNTLNWLVGDHDGDGSQELLVLNGSGGVDVYDFPALTLSHSYSGSNQYWFNPELSDLDGDGKPELLVAGRGSFEILDFTPDSLRSVWLYQEYYYMSEMTQYVIVDDQSADLRSKKLYANIGSDLMEFDVGTRLRSRTINVDELFTDTIRYDIRNMKALAAVDLDGDGQEELVGRGLENIFLIDPINLRVIKTLNDSYTDNWIRGLFDLHLGDTNGDGRPELIWSTGHDASPPASTRIFLQDLAEPDRYWYNIPQTLYLHKFAIADFAANGRPLLIHAQGDDGFSSPRPEEETTIASVYDLTNKRRTPIKNGQLAGLTPLQWDDDPELEMIGTAEARMMVIDYPGFNLLWANDYPTDAGIQFQQLSAVDLDHDGVEEVVGVLNTYAASDHGESRIIVFDNRLNEIFHVPHLFPNNHYVDNFTFAVANTDDDHQLEIVVGMHAARSDYWAVIEVDGVTGQYRLFDFPNVPIEGLELYDTDGDGKAEAILGLPNRVAVFNLTPGSITREIALEPVLGYFPLVANVQVRDFNADGAPELIITHDGSLQVLDFGTGEVLWRSRFLGTQLAPNNSMRIVEVADTARIYVGTEYFLEEFSYTGGLISGARDPNPGLELSVHPNPVAAKVSVSATGVQSSNRLLYQLIDQHGRVVIQGEWIDTTGNLTLDLQSLTRGNYILYLTDVRRGTVGMKKIVKM
ncbi:FG-GAP-like repeat-containing protein [Lewinella sp. JB7]|uniref:FG-GAP-like repeat-containing protein n=1 Tax=Lewinella sp. JB7 TaxID=2962887 RepID=UPI0020C9D6B9|nr:FG-GAP-like repeat-containing protein [Lewinella sp. JB7]MCP9236926.1 T9SS type A sorting domain-containing protein [Lewinella sp. JB7]